MTGNLLALLVRHRNVEGEIVSREVFLWTGWNGTLEVLDFCVSLKLKKFSSLLCSLTGMMCCLRYLLYVLVEFTLELIAFTTEADVRIDPQMPLQMAL